MPNKCVAPNCSVGYKKNDNGNETDRISRFHFPNKETNKDLYLKWCNAVPRRHWTPSKNSVVCEKHFLPLDFKNERLDKNNQRLKTKGKLQRKELKANVVPSQWPMCPTLLSKPPLQKRRTTNTSSESRRDKQSEREESKKEEECVKDAFHSLEELQNKLPLLDDIFVYKSPGSLENE